MQQINLQLIREDSGQSSNEQHRTPSSDNSGRVTSQTKQASEREQSLEYDDLNIPRTTSREYIVMDQSAYQQEIFIPAPARQRGSAYDPLKQQQRRIARCLVEEDDDQGEEQEQQQEEQEQGDQEQGDKKKQANRFQPMHPIPEEEAPSTHSRYYTSHDHQRPRTAHRFQSASPYQSESSSLERIRKERAESATYQGRRGGARSNGTHKIAHGADNGSEQKRRDFRQLVLIEERPEYSRKVQAEPDSYRKRDTVESPAGSTQRFAQPPHHTATLMTQPRPSLAQHTLPLQMAPNKGQLQELPNFRKLQQPTPTNFQDQLRVQHRNQIQVPRYSDHHKAQRKQVPYIREQTNDRPVSQYLDRPKAQRNQLPIPYIRQQIKDPPVPHHRDHPKILRNQLPVPHLRQQIKDPHFREQPTALRNQPPVKQFREQPNVHRNEPAQYTQVSQLQHPMTERPRTQYGYSPQHALEFNPTGNKYHAAQFSTQQHQRQLPQHVARSAHINNQQVKPVLMVDLSQPSLPRQQPTQYYLNSTPEVRSQPITRSSGTQPLMLSSSKYKIEQNNPRPVPQSFTQFNTQPLNQFRSRVPQHITSQPQPRMSTKRQDRVLLSSNRQHVQPQFYQQPISHQSLERDPEHAASYPRVALWNQTARQTRLKGNQFAERTRPKLSSSLQQIIPQQYQFLPISSRRDHVGSLHLSQQRFCSTVTQKFQPQGSRRSFPVWEGRPSLSYNRRVQPFEERLVQSIICDLPQNYTLRPAQSCARIPSHSKFTIPQQRIYLQNRQPGGGNQFLSARS